ncbi:hypothetical protein L3Q82_015526 [Scortum barcoo]|uniref:Uncharacterized protein n=1 Tax=Scortum barcoo TaxID=214431 RepID=A0ACB8VR78_9TELE|nr:hypothetical protein L3Q82_015526 [Scortum barcoo]
MKLLFFFSTGSRVRRDCTEFTSTSCLPCIEGTFMNQPTGRQQCFSCTNCDEGSGLKIKTSCTSTSDTVCEPLEGFYCMDPTENGCQAAQRHKSCRPGQYISHKGTASTDTVCSDCSEGTFSDGTFTSCRPHTQCDSEKPQLIKPGTASSDAECGENNSVTGAVIAVVVVVVIILLTGALLSYFLIKKKRCLDKGGNTDVNSSIPNGEDKAELPLDTN